LQRDFLEFLLNLSKIRGCALCSPLLSGDIISRVLTFKEAGAFLEKHHNQASFQHNQPFKFSPPLIQPLNHASIMTQTIGEKRKEYEAEDED
jgi:hypothetical protein